MKKKRLFAMVLVLVLAFTTGAVAKEVFEIVKAQIRTDFVIEIDGVERKFENVSGERVYPLLYDGTTYLPIRAIGEIMGKEVYWYEADKRIEFKDKKKGPTVTDADVIIEEGKEPKDKDRKDKKDKEEIFKDKDFIGREKAKEIALKKANFKASDVTFIKVEIDNERGVYVYDIEFRKGNREYSAEIRAEDGKILNWETEIDD